MKMGKKWPKPMTSLSVETIIDNSPYQGSHRNWETWKMVVVMELEKLAKSHVISHGILPILPPKCPEIVMLFATTKKLSIRLEGPKFLTFLMQWVFMHIALKGCRPLHTNEPVQFWIGFGLVLIGGSGLNPLGLLAPHWIIQQVIDRNAIENL